MSHELEMDENGNANMAFRVSKGQCWHGLGTPIADDLTPEQMMIAAGLNWTVSKADTFAKFGDQMIPTGRQALIRDTDGKVLTEVGKGWNPVQNAEAFDFFAEFVKAGDMVMDTAGALMGGQIVWCSADVRDGFTILGGDEVKGYLLFSNPHRYGKSLDIKFVMTRTVCNNTLTVALNEKGQASVKLNHRSRFNAEKVKEIHRLVVVRVKVNHAVLLVISKMVKAKVQQSTNMTFHKKVKKVVQVINKNVIIWMISKQQ